MTLIRRFVVLLAVTLSACGGGESLDPSLAGALSHGTMSATINGAAWTPKGAVAVSSSPQIFIVGDDGNIAINMYANVTGPGTYSVVTSTSATTWAYIIGQWTSLNGSWKTTEAGSSGAITVTTFTSSHIVGTFSFEAAAYGPVAGPLHVTNGKFDIAY